MQDDEIIPRLLLAVKRATFVTYDQNLYRQERPHPGYCIVVVSDLAPAEVIVLLRRLFQLPGFSTVADRMGKVALVTARGVRWKELGKDEEQEHHW